MAFWEDFSETISSKGKEMAGKAKNLTDIASLKGQIVTYENAIIRAYKEIGRAYYDAHKDDSSREFPEQMDAVDNAEHMIKDLERRIAELRGTRRCASCDSDVPDDSVYCPKCGVKMENDLYFDEEDSVVSEEPATDIVDDIIDAE